MLPSDEVGPVLPPPPPALAERDWAVTARPTSAWRKGTPVKSVVSLGISLAIMIGIGLLFAAGDPARILSPYWVLVLVVIALQVVALGRRREPVQVTLSSTGVVYEHACYELRADWADVERLVLLSSRPTSLALLLLRPAASREDAGSSRRWRRQPFTWDRVIALEPFLEDDPPDLRHGRVGRTSWAP